MECVNFITSRQHLEEAVARSPERYSNSDNARCFPGTALFELNDFADAATELKKALDPGTAGNMDRKPQARFELAMALRNLGHAGRGTRTAAALSAGKRYAGESHAGGRKGHHGRRRTRPRRTARGCRSVSRGPRGDAHDANLSYKLALALDSAGNFADERTALEDAVSIDPTFALAHYQLGYVDSRLGDLAGAESEFQLAVHSAPACVKAWVSLAATLGMESKFAEAQQAAALPIAHPWPHPPMTRLRSIFTGDTPLATTNSSFGEASQ